MRSKKWRGFAMFMAAALTVGAFIPAAAGRTEVRAADRSEMGTTEPEKSYATYGERELSDDEFPDEVTGLKFKVDMADGTAVITGESNAFSETWKPLEIPSTVTVGEYTLNVTGIGDKAFYIKDYTSLTLPEGIRTIGNDAFYSCSNMGLDLILPNSVEFIGDRAFSACRSLNGKLKLGSSLKYIGEDAFRSCEFSSQLELPEGLEFIGDNAFNMLEELKGDLTIPDSVTYLGEGAFFGCEGFDGKLTIGSGVTEIPREAFYSCMGFKGNFSLPDGVAKIGNSAFYQCVGLSGSLTIPKSVTRIDDEAFFQCSGFTGYLTLPENLEVVGTPFYSCSGLTGIIIGKGCTGLVEGTFKGCSNVKIVENNSSCAVYLSDLSSYGSYTWSDKKTGKTIEGSFSECTAVRDDYDPGDDPGPEPVPGEYTLSDIVEYTWPESQSFKVKRKKSTSLQLIFKDGMNTLVQGCTYTVESGAKCIKNAKLSDVLEDEGVYFVDLTFKGKKKGKVSITITLELTNGQMLDCRFDGKIK